MRTKNNIKSSKVKIRGLGKLGYTESGKLSSTIKRLIGSGVIDEYDTKSSGINKITIVCPVCKKKFKTNNPNLIPNHEPRFRDEKICDGSTSRLVSKEYIIEELPRTYTESYNNINGELLLVNDIVLIDFSRTILNPYNENNITDVLKTKIVRIYTHKYLRNDGTISNHIKPFIVVDKNNIPIPIFDLSSNNCTKYKE